MSMVKNEDFKIVKGKDAKPRQFHSKVANIIFVLQNLHSPPP